MYTVIERDNIEKLLAFLNEEHINPTCLPLDWLVKTDFFKAPASTKWHGAYEGGLFDHSLNVAKNLLRYTKAGLVNWERCESPVIVGILHDLVKVNAYRHYTDEAAGESIFFHNPNHQPDGHGLASANLAEEQLAIIGEFITDEEYCCIRYHMGAYERADWDGFDSAIRKYPAVLWTHMADMEASKLQEE